MFLGSSFFLEVINSLEELRFRNLGSELTMLPSHSVEKLKIYSHFKKNSWKQLSV